MNFELSEQARIDIKQIARYTLLNFGEEQADEYLDGLFYSFDLLTDNPRIGKPIQTDISNDLHRYTYRSHYVVYEVREDMIRIAAIMNTRQEFPQDWKS